MSDQLPSDPGVFAVASGKGGVGKTTTAVNVGAALADSGAKTVVVDADLGMANVADLLDLSIAGPTLQDVLSGELPVEKAIYRTHAGLAVVPGATDLDSYGAVEPERLRAVVETLRAEFEYVFLDAGSGLSHDAVLPLGLADAVVFVTTPTETAARDTGKTRDLAARIDTTVAGVVVTRVREEPSELGPEAVAERVGAPVLTAVPEERAVREALSAGRPAVTYDPGGRVTTAYRRLAAVLTGREAVEPDDSASGSTADEPASLEELLEREAAHPTDVSALTGDATPGTDDPVSDDTDDPTPNPADDPPTLDLDDDGDGPDPLAADPELSDDPDEDGEPAIDADSDDADVGTRTDGDILIAEEAQLDDAGETDDEDDGPEPGDEPSTDDGDGPTTDDEDAPSTDADPMADIPRFDDDSAEEFTRGGEVGDAMAADPLEAGPADDAIGPVEEGADTGTVGDDRDASVEDESDDEPEGDEFAGPRVELTEKPDDAGRTGLLGRLTGLFR